MTVEEYYIKWKKEGNALLTNDAIRFAKVFYEHEITKSDTPTKRFHQYIRNQELEKQNKQLQSQITGKIQSCNWIKKYQRT